MKAALPRALGWALAAAATLLILPVMATAAETVVTGTHETYDDNEVVQAANTFFANGAKDLGNVLGKVLKDKGRPVAFIRGEEAGGAIGVGWRQGINLGYMNFSAEKRINPF